MAAAFEPIQGTAKLGVWDLVPTMLAVSLKRFGVWLALVVVSVGAFLLFLWWSYGPTVSGMDPRARDAVVLNVRDSLQWAVVSVLLAGFSFAVLRVVGLTVLGIWRLGPERRTVTWVIDEVGIRRLDALGAESMVPWSAVVQVQTTRRFVWIKVKPREWRFLLSRAFTAEDHDRLRALMVRMAGRGVGG